MSLYSNSSMDPQKSHLGKELLQEISPVVMVLSSSLAEESCQKNGLSLVEMLIPFSVFSRIDVPVRTASDQPYRLQMFRLRLAYSSDIRQINYEAAEEKLKKVVYDASQMVPDLKSDPPQLETILNESESDHCPSWIQAFNKELIQSVSYSEHEAFDHPVACLLAVSSKEELPINRFIDLFNTSRLPSLLNNGAMDPKILKHYLLIHDNQDDQAEKATNILTEMRNTFGLYGCKLLCINSAKDMSDKLGENPWADIKTKVLDSQEIGTCLSMDDLNGIKECMQDITTKHIIPHMEQKIRILNQQVSATRKGFKNQIKNLWWRKGKEDTPETPIGPTYTFNSIESQIRVLGDYAFMLRDYELALSNYRLLSTDYKLDKAWKRYAGIQEMMGLTFFMLDQSRKEAEYCMETAFTTYLRLGPSGQRNATRCGLWWADMLKFRRQYKDAAGIYFRISVEEPSLHAAVMLEQAAYCYLFSEPPMLRKYAFHLVLAGNRYFMSNQREHAIHMYRNALSVYKGRAWNYINDHVHFNIGRWYAFLGISDVAIKHMLEILACSHQSLATQDLFLKDFFQIVEKLGKMYEVNKLQLPIIDMNSYKVIYEDHRTYASPTNANTRESLWQTLEEDMVPSTYNAKFNWLESKNSSLVKDQNSQVCIVGEAIKLDIEFKNPLHIPLSVSSISLICDLGANPEVAESDKSSPPRSQDGEPSEHPSCSEVNNDDSHVMSPHLDIVLEGGQTKKIQLSITPTTEGILKILGVRWKISELVFGYQYFESEKRRKHRKGKKYQTHSSNFDLTFIVIKGLPKLDGCVRNLPQKSFVGELNHVKLELRNPSKYTLKNIKMKISHPRFLIPGCSEDMEKDFPNCLDSHTSSERKTNQPDVSDNSDSVLFCFPTNTMIQGGTTFVWPLWFHTAISGKISLYISVYYEMEGSFGDMKYRLLRMYSDVEVLPSLDVSFSITPCPLELQEYMVRMDIVNKATSSSFSLQQLSCIGDHWEISTLPEHSTIFPSQVLYAGQALSSFFRLKDCEKGTSKQSEIAVKRNDTLPGVAENVEKLIDISKTPLADFHRYERHRQEIAAKANRNNIDFILISKLQEDGSNPNFVGSKVLSHHICHCSFNSRSPISYLMMGPKTTTHDFSTSFCEVALLMRIHNLVSYPVSIKITTCDSIPAGNTTDSSGSNGGWHEVQLASEVKATSDALKVSSKKSTVPSISPFVWCASSCTQMKVGPECTVEKSLRVCLFSPGVYDLSNYEVHWKIEATDEVHGNIKKNISGMGHGHPFCITALQSSSVDVE